MLCGSVWHVVPTPYVHMGLIEFAAEYAEKYVMDMQINGRYNVEAW